MKKCSKCSTEKPLDDFGKHSKTKDGKQVWCKLCSREAAKKNRALNIDARKEYDKQYSLKNRKRKTQNYLNWRKNNPEKAKAATDRGFEYRKRWAEENKPQLREAQREWRKRNKDKIAAHDGIRRRRHKSATPVWLTKEQRQEISAIYKSAKTRSIFHEISYHVDHIEPLKGVNENGEHVSCGMHVPWNLAIIEGSENVRKSNKLNTQ